MFDTTGQIMLLLLVPIMFGFGFLAGGQHVHAKMLEQWDRTSREINARMKPRVWRANVSAEDCPEAVSFLRGQGVLGDDTGYLIVSPAGGVVELDPEHRRRLAAAYFATRNIKLEYLERKAGTR